jgi:hypothetical protein
MPEKQGRITSQQLILLFSNPPLNLGQEHITVSLAGSGHLGTRDPACGQAELSNRAS